MSKYITQAVYGGTKQNYAVRGATVDSVMMSIRKRKEFRNASCFLFFSRKTGKMVDVRFN